MRRSATLTLAVLFILATAFSAAWGEPAYSPARSCGACHDVMLKAWSDSPHARSATSPSYLEALRRATAGGASGKTDRHSCVWCHAPITLVTGDLDLMQDITGEGVTCDFCHTVASVDLDKSPPFEPRPGRVKRGPFDYANVPGHQTAYSLLHRASPMLCAACHEYTNSHGVRVLS